MNKLNKLDGYNGYYVTECGKLYSDRSGKLKEIKGSPDKDGYLKITLVNKFGKPEYLMKHRIIMFAFNGKSDKQVNHKDGNKLNNNIENLEYVTNRENQCHRRLKAGYNVGVCWAKKEKKWRAYIQENKKWEHLGFFETKEKAKQTYINRLKELNIENKYAK